MKKYQLMAPGPTPVPPTVLLAMAQPIIHHRAAEYDALFREVREGLKRLVQTRQDVLVPACTGTGAMEAAAANTLSAGDRVIVVNAGAFAQRWLAICKAYGPGAPGALREGVDGRRAVDPAEVLPRPHRGAEVLGQERGPFHAGRLDHGGAPRGAPDARGRGAGQRGAPS